MYRKGSFLTKELLERMFIQDKKTATEIAENLGISSTTVSRAIQEFKLAPSHYRYETLGLKKRKRIKELYAQGISIAKIAEDINVSQSVVHDRLNKWNLKKEYKRLPTRSWAKEETDMIVKLRKDGLIRQEIADKMGIDLVYVMNKLAVLSKRDKIANDWTEIEPKFKELFEQGKPYGEIAEVLGVHHYALCDVAVEKGYISELKQKQIDGKIYAAQGLKKCYTCNTVKQIEEFYTPVTSKCNECNKKRSRKRNIDVNSSIELFLRDKLWSAKERAVKKNWEFDLTLEFLLDLYKKQDGKCFYTGIPLVHQNKQFNSISVDRKDSKIPYLQNNTVLCCKMINTLKMDLNVEQFQQLIVIIYQYMKLDKNSFDFSNTKILEGIMSS